MSTNQESATNRFLTAVIDIPPAQRNWSVLWSAILSDGHVARTVGLEVTDLLRDQPARQSFDLMTDRERAHLRDLGRRRKLRIDVDLRAREPAQGALGGRVDDAALLHQLEHQLHGVFMDDDGVVGHERADADRVVHRKERLDAGTEGAVVLLAEVVGAEAR